MRHPLWQRYSDATRLVPLVRALAVTPVATATRSDRARKDQSPFEHCDSHSGGLIALARIVILLSVMVPLIFSDRAVASMPAFQVAAPFLSSVTHLASAASGPTMIPENSSSSLWDQTAPGEWVWNPAGDPWPLPFAASDPTGVCEMILIVSGSEYVGPSSVLGSSQCPQTSMTWVASVDTRAIIGAGSLPIDLSATDPAGLAGSDYEAVNVDNVPVTVSLQPVSDPNPALWVNHAVTVDAIPHTGPSGVDRTDCSIDNGPLQPYSSQGVTVDGDGVHTVSCTAWNTAVDPQGQNDSGTSSIRLYIDEVPPSISFEPRTATAPTELVVDTTDDESGVAGGLIQIAPAGTNEWENLPTGFDGQHLTAQLEDDHRQGPYVVKATSCDNAGNCASATESIIFPLRITPDLMVSLTKIVQPTRQRVFYKQVLVGWHWTTVRRGGRPVRVKRGGHLQTIRVVETVERCTTKRVRTKAGRLHVQRSCTTPHPHATTKLTVPYGRDVVVHGLFTTELGVPLPGQSVDIYTSLDNYTDAFREVATATTGSDGSWTATLPPGPSRIIRAVTYGTATILPSSAHVTAIVPADIRLLRVWPRHVTWGGTVHLVGQLLGGYLPPGGALVRLRIGYGSTYNTYGVQEHVTGNGQFSTVATFGPGDPSIQRTYWFQIASLPMGDYPYAPAASQRVPVIVGGDPG
jgi:hypothetical protein